MGRVIGANSKEWTWKVWRSQETVGGQKLSQWREAYRWRSHGFLGSGRQPMLEIY